MYETNSHALDTDPEDDGYDIAFGSAEWHRRAEIVGAKLTELVANLPEASRERPLAEIVAEDHGPGVGVRTYEEMLIHMEVDEALGAVQESDADSDVRELVA